MLITAKFILRKKVKDYYEIFLIGILIVLLSSVSTISISFSLILFLFFISGALMLIFARINNITFRISLKFLKEILLFSTVSFVLAFLLFFSFPRLSIGYFHGINIAPANQSGFSEEVVIEKGNVSLKNGIVMRIETKDSSAPLYLSGMHYSYFDGSKWRKEKGIQKIFPYNASNDFGLIQGTSKYTVYLEPTGTNVLFGPNKFTGVHGEFLYLIKNKFGDFSTDMTYYKTVKYDAFSNIVGKTNIQLIDKLTNKDIKQYLQLPLLPERFKEISIETAGGGNEQKKVLAIKNYLNKHCAYSLKPSASSISDFVINGKSGYCEHFATASVLMLRENGIPARLVSGFVTNEFNPEGNYFIVRERDAHTWAEVYFPSAGWMRFDPTPASSPPIHAKISLMIDNLKMSWYRNVITYNSAKQAEFLSGIKKGVTNTGYKINNGLAILHSLLKRWRYLASLFALALITYIFVSKEKSKKNRAYNSIIRTIGNDKYPYETLLEYAERKGKADDLKNIIFLYYKLRFSKNHMDEKAVLTLLNRLKKKL